MIQCPQAMHISLSASSAVTGGKSTLLRQACLAALLAQASVHLRKSAHYVPGVERAGVCSLVSPNLGAT
jgi:hypothetical protein